MGVPGAKSHLLAPGYGNKANMAKNCKSLFCKICIQCCNSVIADFVSQKPTFFSLWIGNNDVYYTLWQVLMIQKKH
jgi:hypothetical protein